MTSPTLGPMRRTSGVAGQYAIIVEVTYPGEHAETLQFVGSTYGGPVVMITPGGHQTFVTDPERFGAFGPDWVRNFFDQPIAG